MVSELKEAVSSHGCSHSLTRYHHNQLKVRVQNSLSSSILPSPCSLHTFCVLCRTLATDANMLDLGVCSPPDGCEIASVIAMSTT